MCSHRLLVSPGFLLSLGVLALAAQNAVYYTIDTIAGADPAIGAGLATTILLQDVRGVASDLAGNVYFSDTPRNRVYRIGPFGSLTPIAGTGTAGFSGDGGLAEQAMLDQPYGVAVDNAGNVYIADLGNARVRRVTSDGRIATIAGGGAELKGPRNLALDPAGNLYISDFEGHRIFRLSADGRVAAVAGTGSPGPARDNSPALTSPLAYPAGLFADASSGAIYVADSANHAIRRIAGGVIATPRILNAEAYINLPTGVCLDASGNLIIASSGFDQAVRVSPAGAAQVLARGARDVAIDGAGNLYLAAGAFVRKLPPGGLLTTLAGASGQFRGEGTRADQALLYAPSDVAMDSDGLLIADSGNHRLRRITPAGLIVTLAGDGESGSRGDGGPAQRSRLSSPRGVTADRSGNIYIADTDNHAVRKITSDGQIQTVAGAGTAGFNGEIVPAQQAQLSSPTGVAVDPGGSLYIADTGNHRVRRIIPGGYLLTMMGTGRKGFSGDGGVGLNAQLDRPLGICFDRAGNLYIADSGNHRIRKVSKEGYVSTVAGKGTAGFSGDGGAAVEARLNQPVAVSADSTGALFISDAGNACVRRVTPDGLIATIAGSGAPGFSGDGGPALSAKFEEPAGIAADAAGNVYVADRLNHRIRKLTPVASPAAPEAVKADLAVLHGATLEATAVAAGMVISLEGAGIGPVTPASGRLGPNGSLETTVSDTQVRFDGRPAPILYAQRNLISVQAPYRVFAQLSTKIEVFRQGALRAQASVSIVRTAPGIFTTGGGAGPAVAVNENGTLHSATNPASKGALLVFYATGEGITDPAGAEGRLAEPPYPAPVAPLEVTIGGEQAEVVAAGASVTGPGVLQVTVRAPSQVAAGPQPLVLTVGGVRSQRDVTVYLR
ncbi:MAG: hypothetical protein HY235_29560 [Acidobacteria bacterium]|nr:hypothetical protein [Acidobacteriota bacterium]